MGSISGRVSVLEQWVSPLGQHLALPWGESQIPAPPSTVTRRGTPGGTPEVIVIIPPSLTAHKGGSPPNTPTDLGAEG